MKPTEMMFLLQMMYFGRDLFDWPPTKQEIYYLDKWRRKGWWEYGVSMRAGSFTLHYQIRDSCKAALRYWYTIVYQASLVVEYRGCL